MINVLSCCNFIKKIVQQSKLNLIQNAIKNTFFDRNLKNSKQFFSWLNPYGCKWIDSKIELSFYLFSKTCYIISFHQLIEFWMLRIKRFQIQ